MGMALLQAWACMRPRLLDEPCEKRKVSNQFESDSERSILSTDLSFPSTLRHLNYQLPSSIAIPDTALKAQ
jgi:hypothetical protein